MLVNPSAFSQYAIYADMLDACRVVAQFDTRVVDPVVNILGIPELILLTGEGSSRIFPAKNAIWHEQ